MTVSLTGHVDVPADRLDAVRAALPEHIRLTRAETGCLHFNVTESAELPGRLLVSESFTSPEAFRAHQARLAATAWAEVTTGLERHYTITGLGA